MMLQASVKLPEIIVVLFEKRIALLKLDSVWYNINVAKMSHIT